MKKMLKRTAAALLSLALLGPALPFKARTFSMPNFTLSAQAAGNTASLSGSTLTLSGNVFKADVQAYADNGGVRSIVAKPGTVFPADCSSLFYNFPTVQSIDLRNADTSKVTNMDYMFAYCYSLTDLDISNFDTSNVTRMHCMFLCCDALTTLDVSSFDTSNVKIMKSIFGGCKALTTLDVSSFDTSNVTNMSGMFSSCSSLTTIDVSTFDTSKVTDMSIMFGNCSSLTTIDVSNFDTSNVTNIMAMFAECDALTTLDLSGFDTSNVTRTAQMFLGCDELTTLDLSSFDTSSVTYMRYMFRECKKLNTIYASSKWNNRMVDDSTDMFSECYNLIGLNGTTYDSSHVDCEYARIDGEKNLPGYFSIKDFPELVSNSMTLGGAISLNFYYDLSSIPEEWHDLSYVDFEVNGKHQTANFDPNKMNSKKTAYGFTCILNSVSMADKVNATMHYFDADGEERTLTVTSTAESYLKKFNSGDPEKLWNLIKGINDYGYYMQSYLSQHSASPWTIDVDHIGMSTNYLKPANLLKNKDTYLSELASQAKTKTLVEKDLSNISYALQLDSNTNMKITIKPQSSYKGSVTVKVDGKYVTPTRSGSNYVVVIDGISAHKLGDMHTVSVKTANGTSTFKASALSYAYDCFGAPIDRSETYAMGALYEYYKAAKAYKG